MTRLAILWLLILATAIIALVCWYVLTHKQAESSVILALSAILTALVLKGAVAIKNRNGGIEDKD